MYPAKIVGYQLCRQLTADSYLFLQQNSDLLMTPSTFTARFKKILKTSGLPEKLNVHSLRHTNASLMIANGVDVTTVAGLLGHAQPSTTLDIYSHAFDKNKKKAHEELQKGLGVQSKRARDERTPFVILINCFSSI